MSEKQLEWHLTVELSVLCYSLFCLRSFAIPYQLNRNYFCCGRKVISGQDMSRDHAGSWGSPLITCGVMKPLKNDVHADSLGWADLLLIPADMSTCMVTLVSSLVVSSSLPVPSLERQWYQGILHPIPVLAPLPFMFSLINIWEPDLQLESGANLCYLRDLNISTAISL